MYAVKLDKNYDTVWVSDQFKHKICTFTLSHFPTKEIKVGDWIAISIKSKIRLAGQYLQAIENTIDHKFRVFLKPFVGFSPIEFRWHSTLPWIKIDIIYFETDNYFEIRIGNNRRFIPKMPKVKKYKPDN